MMVPTPSVDLSVHVLHEHVNFLFTRQHMEHDESIDQI